MYAKDKDDTILEGIYVENAGYATIVGNEFNIGSKSDCSFGIYAECVSGFTIEENTFIGDNLYLSTNYGIAIKNSRAYNDIYLNEFRNLNCGNISIGNNINSTISSAISCKVILGGSTNV